MTYEYEVAGEKVQLEVDPTVVAVRFTEPALHSTRAAVSASSGLGAFSERIEVPNEKFTIIPVAALAQSQPQRHAAVVKSLKSSKDVSRVAPVFKLSENRKAVATDRVLVGFKDKSKHKELLKKLALTVLEEKGNEYVLQLEEDADPFEACKKLAANKEVEYAEPDLVTIGRHNARPPMPEIIAPALPSPQANNDPLLSKQYAMTITKALDAWNLQVGDPAIKIAVLDEGVDTAHEDLASAIVGAYDGVQDDTFQEPNSWDGHGTACAGLAAAIPQNNRGVRGTGGGCSILAVRIALSSAPGEDWTTSNSIIARSIDWAWRNGADVLSNSWGGGAPSSAINNAFERARTQGRAGKGCVIVVAAGNDSGPVGYPATLPTVLAVSATNEFDEFKTKTSSDGENWWGSNFGPEVDISAPGVHNHTTDISGSAGYAAGHYTPNFNGTSSATPIVAGAVGLILSANKALTEDAVRKVITQAADKVGPFPYVNGRNDRFGNGRLNVLKAIQAVKNQVENGTSFQGTILQWGNGSIKPGAFFLQTTNSEVFLLKHYIGNEPSTSQVLEKQSLNYLAQFVGANRTVTFLQRQDTPQGSILWGVNVS